MKLPEYLTSTTRLTLLLFAGVCCYGFLIGKLSPEIFTSIVMSVFGFFFGSRKKEEDISPKI